MLMINLNPSHLLYMKHGRVFRIKHRYLFLIKDRHLHSISISGICAFLITSLHSIPILLEFSHYYTISNPSLRPRRDLQHLFMQTILPKSILKWAFVLAGIVIYQFSLMRLGVFQCGVDLGYKITLQSCMTCSFSTTKT